ncbi:MAG: hypothetical protein E7361_04020 [Clostridiales bacterium]|nr:hypothetical protein [Clostridiales bacterium]
MENNNYVIELLRGFIGQHHDPCAFVFHDKDGHEVITVMSDNKKLDKLADGGIKKVFCAGDEKNPCKTAILPRADVLDLPNILDTLGKYNCAFHVANSDSAAMFITTNRTDLARLEYPIIDNYCDKKIRGDEFNTLDDIKINASMDILAVVDGYVDGDSSTHVNTSVNIEKSGIEDKLKSAVSREMTRKIYSAMNNKPEYIELRNNLSENINE